MFQFDIRCRHDGLPEFFEANCRYADISHKHFPFLVFIMHDYALEVAIVTDPGQLMIYADKTQVMKQWPGKTRSDYFKFTVGELREYLKQGPTAPPHAGWQF